MLTCGVRRVLCMNAENMSYLYDDVHVVLSPYGCEADELRVGIVGHCCGAGQGFIGYFYKYTARKNPIIFSCRCVIC